MKKNHLHKIIAALIILNIFTIFRLNRIENLFENKIQQIYNSQNNLRNDINNIYFNVDEELKKQASLFDSSNVNFGDEINSDNYTVPVKISVTPKENKEKLTAELLVNDERYPMKKDGIRFTGTVDAYIFEPFKVMISLNDNGTERIETIDEYKDLQHKYILDLYGNFSGTTKFNSGKYVYEGDIDFFGPADKSIEKISIQRYVNNKITDETEVTMQGYGHAEHFPVKGEVELFANDKIELYIYLVDKYGLNYKYIVLSDEIDSDGKLKNMRPEWTTGSLVEIKDKNGKILFDNGL